MALLADARDGQVGFKLWGKTAPKHCRGKKHLGAADGFFVAQLVDWLFPVGGIKAGVLRFDRSDEGLEDRTMERASRFRSGVHLSTSPLGS